jgi:hypothetical protein
MTLDEFIAKQQASILGFREMWLASHADSPEQYSLELPDDNSGLWDEMYAEYMS